MPKRYSYEEVKLIIEEQGFTLVSTSYKNDSTKLDMLCPEGHQINISFNGWQNRKGNGCKACQSQKSSKQTNSCSVASLTVGDLRQAVELEGYVLLIESIQDGPYKEKIRQKINLRCPKGHTYSTSLRSWLRGNRCPKCLKEGLSHNFDYIKVSIESEGYALLSEKYENAHSKLQIKCPEGHLYETDWGHWKAGRRCPVCSNQSKRATVESVQRNLNKTESKFICLDTLFNPDKNRSVFTLRCPNGHEFNVVDGTWWYTPSRCPICDNYKSKYEKYLAERLSEDFEVVVQDRKSIAPLEIDIFLPSLNIGIEVNGLYWHSELAGGKDKHYHIGKLEQCLTKNIRLISIFEDELINNFGLVWSRVENILGVSSGFKIMARECQIRQISSSEAGLFLNQHHTQRRGKSSVRYGAFYGDYLVSVMTFSKSNLAKRQTGWELDRFCSHPDFCVVGIASKLLRRFETDVSYESLVSFADRRWSTGNLYYQLGFTLDRMTRPNYWYLDKNKTKRIHRFALRKNKDDDPNLTEWENRKLQGYDRIWDCGSMRFVKHDKRRGYE